MLLVTTPYRLDLMKVLLKPLSFLSERLLMNLSKFLLSADLLFKILIDLGLECAVFGGDLLVVALLQLFLLSLIVLVLIV